MFLLVCDHVCRLSYTNCSYEGERTQCRDNRLLGEFELTGIPPMPRGQAELVTTFEVDANGLLKVSAQDRASGRKASISMYASRRTC
jgi:heat shock 70kDa protein 1/2/6/8